MKKSPSDRKENHRESFKLAMEMAAILISLAALICTLYFSGAQKDLALLAEKREAREAAFSYSLEAVQGTCAYHISYMGREYDLPAPSYAITVTAGELSFISAIAYTGSGYKVLGSFQPQLEGNEYCIKIDAEAQESPMVQDDLAFDYFFLYLLPVTGSPVLDLVCTEIDLKTSTITPRIYHQIDLLTQTSNPSPISADMLAVYEHLYTEILSLPSIS